MAVFSPLFCTWGLPYRNIKDKNMIFALDISESMYSKLEAVKYYLIQTLFTQAYALINCKFNIIAFAGKVAKYCDNLIDCTPQAVEKIIPWIRSLECQTGRNMQHALAVALDDPATDAVYLITDGIPDIKPQEVYTILMNAAKGRPVHTLYVMESYNESEVHECLEKIAWQTGASFQAARLNTSESTKQLIPVYQFNYSDPIRTNSTEMNCCSMAAALSVDPYNRTAPLHVAVPFSCSTLHPYDVKIITKGDLVDSYAGQLIRGVRVLAQREYDGFYYLGRLGQEVKGCPGRFLVQFDKDKKTKRKVHCRMHETALHDIIHYEDAQRHAIGPGCKVLAPWEIDMDCYGPGTVLQGREERGLNSDHACAEGLIVNFWNGRTEKVQPGIAIWIPVFQSQRIILELQMTTTAKQKLLETYPDYPQVVPPGYRGLQRSMEPVYHFRGIHSDRSQAVWIPYNPARSLSLDGVFPVKSVASRSELKNEKVLGIKLTTADLNQKVTDQLTQHDLTVLSKSLMKKKNGSGEVGGTGNKSSPDRITDKMTIKCKSANLVDMSRPKSTIASRALNTDCGLLNLHQGTKKRKEKDAFMSGKRIPSIPPQKISGLLSISSLQAQTLHPVQFQAQHFIN
ncbi:uncharacterized protein LOC125461095 isoform X2 [Stegostoma tigrinum]|uniref:uncharacterized protein LOC125461095 isoform X2 n=1 Tax=Stegostoma tigrinum TaxID=3053191 RepID=UPI00202B6BC1|nr:uncharacterized protein LOC125461095 isoform X2 [Stegostoma tigrinum]